MEELIEGELYWVNLGDDHWIPAEYSKTACGDWTNNDTWEDFDNEVIDWIRIPSPAILKNKGR